jgi:hypothetical protein
MDRYRIRHLPVLEEGRPLEIVCDRDLSIAEAIFKETHHTSAAHVVRLLGRAGARRVQVDALFDDVLRDMFRDRVDAVLVLEGARWRWSRCLAAVLLLPRP